MPGYKDAARMMAADSLSGVELPGQSLPDAGGGDQPPSDPAADVESGLSMVESALATADPAVAEEARAHIEALRQIATKLKAEPGPDTGPEPGPEPAGAETPLPPK